MACNLPCKHLTALSLKEAEFLSCFPKRLIFKQLSNQLRARIAAFFIPEPERGQWEKQDVLGGGLDSAFGIDIAGLLMEAVAKRLEARKPHAGLVNLSGWDYSTLADGRPALDLRVELGASGHLGVSVRGFDSETNLIFAARIPNSESPLSVDRHHLTVPLDVARSARPGAVADVLDITLHLDKGEQGTAPFDISKQYMTGSGEWSDEVFFYAPLPPRGMPGGQ